MLSGDRARIDIEDRLGRSFIVLARDRMRGGDSWDRADSYCLGIGRVHTGDRLRNGHHRVGMG